MSEPFPIQFEPSESNSTAKDILKELQTYNTPRFGESAGQGLTFSVRDPQGHLKGGLTGRTHWGWLYIAMLWVDTPYRKAGLGAKLVRAAEDEAIRRGCRHAYLDTFSDEALRFYEKQGYRPFGMLADFPPGHRRFFLQKDLRKAEP